MTVKKTTAMLNQLTELLSLLRTDATMALTGEWDCSEEGFHAQIENIDNFAETHGLTLVNRAVASRPSHPVLANIWLHADAEKQTVTLRAFDLSLGIQSTFPADVQHGGSVTLPTKCQPSAPVAQGKDEV